MVCVQKTPRRLRRRDICHRNQPPSALERIPTLSLFLLLTSVESFSIRPPGACWGRPPQPKTATTRLGIYAPPGSGYARPEDEENLLPDTYEPMMEYPGTMRPGRTPENIPYQDLPIGDDDPDPVPWPHFQQIEWHHRWEPPHDPPIPMEDFIEMHGRWATPEMEAAMRAGVRRGVREQRVAQEAGVRETIITDDDEEEEGDEDFQAAADDVPIAMGDGVFGQLGSAADMAATAVATSPDRQEQQEEEKEAGEDSFDDFLFDLGLDVKVEDDVSGGSETAEATTKPSSDQAVSEDQVVSDEEDEEEEISMKSSQGATPSINVDEDSDLDLGLDEEDELEGGTVPLEDFGDSEDMLDTEDIFDEGGFDFGDDFDSDGGDSW